MTRPVWEIQQEADEAAEQCDRYRQALETIATNEGFLPLGSIEAFARDTLRPNDA
jgi:hypothetical protein